MSCGRPDGHLSDRWRPNRMDHGSPGRVAGTDVSVRIRVGDRGSRSCGTAGGGMNGTFGMSLALAALFRDIHNPGLKLGAGVADGAVGRLAAMDRPYSR